MVYNSNVIPAAAIIDGKSCYLQIWTFWKSVIPTEMYVGAALQHLNINCSDVIWIRLGPTWGWFCPQYCSGYNILK